MMKNFHVIQLLILKEREAHNAVNNTAKLFDKQVLAAREN